VSEFLRRSRLEMYRNAFEELKVFKIEHLEEEFERLADEASMKLGHRKKLRRLLQNRDACSDLKIVPSVRCTRESSPLASPAMKWDYELSRTLKNTLFGKVKYGVRRKDLLPVAVKISDKSKIRGTRTLESPGQEAMIMSTLGSCQESTCHENLLQLVGVVEDSLEIWTIVQFASDGELFGHVKKGVGYGDEKSVRTLFRGMVRGVHHMHHNNVAHLDLSLENVLLHRCPKTNKLVPKICDFGMARQVEPCGASAVIDGATFQPGKWLYMAPEVYRMEKFCPKSADVYSLGVILFMLLSGTPPYTVPSSSDPRFRLVESGSVEGIRSLLTSSNALSPSNDENDQAQDEQTSEPSESASPGISKDALDLLSYLLCPTSKRLNAKEILCHPFLREDSVPSSPSKDSRHGHALHIDPSVSTNKDIGNSDAKTPPARSPFKASSTSTDNNGELD